MQTPLPAGRSAIRERPAASWRDGDRPEQAARVAPDQLSGLPTVLADWRVFRGGMLGALAALLVAPAYLATVLANRPSDPIIGIAVAIFGSLLGLAVLTSAGLLLAWVAGRSLTSHAVAVAVAACAFIVYGGTDGVPFAIRSLLAVVAMTLGVLVASALSGLTRTMLAHAARTARARRSGPAVGGRRGRA